MSLTSRRTVMARKRYKPEEIVAKLRQVDVLVSQGQNMVDAIRQIGAGGQPCRVCISEPGSPEPSRPKKARTQELFSSGADAWSDKRCTEIKFGLPSSVRLPKRGLIEKIVKDSAATES